MKIYETQTRVRYSETDASGIVYYANYFVYFELGRLDLFRRFDLPYDWRLPIADTYCRYHAWAAFGDLLLIHTFLEEVRSKGFRLGCRVYRAGERDGEEPRLLAEGYTAMVTLGEDQKPTPLPAPFRRAFQAMSEDA